MLEEGDGEDFTNCTSSCWFFLLFVFFSSPDAVFCLEKYFGDLPKRTEDTVIMLSSQASTVGVRFRILAGFVAT